jgi:abequosyltransferase
LAVDYQTDSLMTPALPKLSICIPAYNRAQYLPPLLDSIFSQGYPNLEIVISEDNSPERLQIAQVVQAYEEQGYRSIRYFENEKTQGFDAIYAFCLYGQQATTAS